MDEAKTTMDGPNRLGQAGKDNRTAGQQDSRTGHDIHLEIEDVLHKKKKSFS